MTQNDFSEKMDCIEGMLRSNDFQLTNAHRDDFVTLVKYLLYVATKEELPTPSNYPSKVQDVLKNAGSAQKVRWFAFRTPEQKAILHEFESAKQDKRIVLSGPWGCGKTILMEDFAKKAAQEKDEKVLFLVLKKQASSIDSMLVQRLRCHFKEHPNIKVRSIFLSNHEPQGNNILKLTKEYQHIFVDEAYGDFQHFHDSTTSEFLRFLAQKETAVISLCTPYYQSSQIDANDDEEKLKALYATYEFKIVIMQRILRCPQNVILGLRDYLQESKKERILHRIESLTLNAEVPPKLPKTDGPWLWTDKKYQENLDHCQWTLTVKEVVKEAIKIAGDERLLIVINDSQDNQDLTDFKNKIRCQCKEMIMYLTLHHALVGLRRIMLFHCGSY